MRLIVFLFILLATYEVVLADKNCDQFYYLSKESRKTCPNTIIEVMTVRHNVEIIAKIADCNAAQGNKYYASVLLSNPQHGWVLRRVQPEADYYFEYSIQWESPDTNCIIELIPFDTSKEVSESWSMIDQNGIPNTPSAVRIHTNIILLSY